MAKNKRNTPKRTTRSSGTVPVPAAEPEPRRPPAKKKSKTSTETETRPEGGNEVEQQQTGGVAPLSLADALKQQKMLLKKITLLRRKESLEKEIADRREAIAKLDNQSAEELEPSDEEEKGKKSHPKAKKKSKKRSREESSESSDNGEDSGISEAESQVDLGSGDDSSSDSSEDAEKTKPKDANKGKPNLRVALVLAHWRREAKLLDDEGKLELRTLLRLIRAMRKTITQQHLQNFVNEMQLIFLKHTDSADVAERYRINASSGRSRAGALDPKAVRVAQKQAGSRSPKTQPKNEAGTPKARRPSSSGSKHKKWERPNRKSAQLSAAEPEGCFVCGKFGHRAAMCKQRASAAKTE